MLLSLLILLPLFSALMVFCSEKDEKLLKVNYLITTIVTLLLTLIIWFLFDNSSKYFQFTQEHYTLDNYDSYLGLDSLSVCLYLLPSLTLTIIIISNWRCIDSKTFYLSYNFSVLLFMSLSIHIYPGMLAGFYGNIFLCLFALCIICIGYKLMEIYFNYIKNQLKQTPLTLCFNHMFVLFKFLTYDSIVLDANFYNNNFWWIIILLIGRVVTLNLDGKFNLKDFCIGSIIIILFFHISFFFIAFIVFNIPKIDIIILECINYLKNTPRPYTNIKYDPHIPGIFTAHSSIESTPDLRVPRTEAEVRNTALLDTLNSNHMERKALLQSKLNLTKEYYKLQIESAIGKTVSATAENDLALMKENLRRQQSTWNTLTILQQNDITRSSAMPMEVQRIVAVRVKEYNKEIFPLLNQQVINTILLQKKYDIYFYESDQEIKQKLINIYSQQNRESHEISQLAQRTQDRS